MDYDQFEEITNLAANDDKYFELIDGHIYMISTSSTSHAQIVGYIHGQLFNYLRGKHFKPYMNVSVRLWNKNSDKNSLIPDLFISRNPEQIKEDCCSDAPDFVLEVISPSTVGKDYLIKKFKYMQYGVREYWIVDREAGRITVIAPLSDPKNGVSEEYYTFDDTVKFNIFDDLHINFKELSEYISGFEPD
ncbi:MAG: Uma2 family endonuclease [Clostridiales bacterium]|nr:Uma2 family endonuclease [Clostridiales bacterium]